MLEADHHQASPGLLCSYWWPQTARMKRAARSRGLSRQQEGFPKPHRPARPQESTEQHPQATEVELDSVAAAAWCESIFNILEALARGETPDRVAIDAARPIGGLRRLHVYELVEAAGRLAGIAASAEASSRCPQRHGTLRGRAHVRLLRVAGASRTRF